MKLLLKGPVAFSEETIHRAIYYSHSFWGNFYSIMLGLKFVPTPEALDGVDRLKELHDPESQQELFLKYFPGIDLNDPDPKRYEEFVEVFITWWTHCAGTIDGDQKTVELDGKQVMFIYPYEAIGLFDILF